MIHVISNVTNAGTKYENSIYRGGKLNEAITDLITIELCQANGISGYDLSAYADFYAPGYYFINEYDMLETYYYSDGYDKIISQMGKDELDLAVLLLNSLYTSRDIQAVFMHLVSQCA